jgi:hypothetical protein
MSTARSTTTTSKRGVSCPIPPQTTTTEYLLPTGTRPPFDELNKISALGLTVRYVRMIQHLYDSSLAQIDIPLHTKIDINSLYDVVKFLCETLSIEDTTTKKKL